MADPKFDAITQQIDRLATFIMDNIPGEPSRSEGAVDTAIRLLSRLRAAERVIETSREVCHVGSFSSMRSLEDYTNAITTWEAAK